jgi:predicted P-loop ATPase
MLATATNFIFNLDDYFAGITARKINEFKGLLTKNTIKVRRPYARYTEEMPKICSFIASSNEAQFST